MKTRCLQIALLLAVSLGWLSSAALADDSLQEFVTTTPILADGVLYTASFSRPEQAGHLRATDLTDSTPQQLWDAAEQMPAAGTGADPGDQTSSDPPMQVDPDNLYRFLFSNLESRTGIKLQRLSPLDAAILQPALAAGSLSETEQLLNQLRGRSEVTAETPDGTGDLLQRLWGISRSTPAVVGRSLRVTGAADRDQVVYAGAEDGLLHAFYAGQWQTETNRYDQESPTAGQELWGYLPGQLLSGIKEQPFAQASDDFAIHVDGAPVASDLFADWNGDGLQQWRTYLTGTASLPLQGRSCAFAFDITDPRHPVLLWEKALPGSNPGLTRGLVIGTPAAEPNRPVLYLTTAYALKTNAAGLPDPINGSYGLRACALDPLSGNLLWQWQSPYAPPLTNINTAPAVPALLDIDGNGLTDYLVFGDMAGRLWALDAANGTPLNGGPVYQVENGAEQPIGASVTTAGRLVVFGTGGAEHADPAGSYAIYAVEVLPTGGQLRWIYPLDPGEQVWAAPNLDRVGRIYFAASTDYQPGESPGGSATGRLVILDKEGQPLVETPTDSPVAGQVQVGDGAAIAVSLSGRVYQFGNVRQRTVPVGFAAQALHLLSWRVR